MYQKLSVDAGWRSWSDISAAGTKTTPKDLILELEIIYKNGEIKMII